MAKTTSVDPAKILAAVPDEYVFRLCDGRVLKDMKALSEALADMPEETFAFHVNSEKNDFAKWVKDIICDDRLADDLMRSKDHFQAARAVSLRISTLTRSLPKAVRR